MTRYVYGAATVAASYEGSSILVSAGAIWDADDPFVKLHPELFCDHPSPDAVNRTVSRELIEQATAAPGKRRTTRRPR